MVLETNIKNYFDKIVNHDAAAKKICDIIFLPCHLPLTCAMFKVILQWSRKIASGQCAFHTNSHSGNNNVCEWRKKTKFPRFSEVLYATLVFIWCSVNESSWMWNENELNQEITTNIKPCYARSISTWLLCFLFLFTFVVYFFL